MIDIALILKSVPDLAKVHFLWWSRTYHVPVETVADCVTAETERRLRLPTEEVVE